MWEICWKYTICALLLFESVPGVSQSDTEFWFVAPEVSTISGDNPITLVVSSISEATSVVLSQPANPSFSPLSYALNPGEVKMIDLSDYLDQLENKPANLRLKYGLLLTSDHPVSAYYQISHPQNAEIYTWKGRDALGTEFYIPAQTNFRNQIGGSVFDIVATRDSTVIEITPKSDIIGHRVDETFSIVLNRGETFSCRESGQATAGYLAGSYIVSTAPIAITNTDEAIFNETGTQHDLIGDQLIPVSLTGKEYIAVKAESDTERLYLTATRDSTTLRVNGSRNAMLLDAGEHTFIDIKTASIYLEASEPVYVWHLSGYEAQPAASVLFPITCTGTRIAKYVRDASDNFITYLFSRAEHVEGFRLNGTSNLVPSYFSAVPGTNGKWMAARVEAFGSFAVSTNQISNELGPFHMSMMTYYGTSSTFATFSDASPLTLSETQLLCEKDTLELDAGPDQSSYFWNTGETRSIIKVAEPGIYWVNTEFAECTFSDTVEVLPADLSLDLGRDTSLCEGDSLVISLKNVEGTIEWNDGSKTSRKVLQEEGVYSAFLNLDGCEIRDSIQVSIKSLPELTLGNDTLICDGEILSLKVAAKNAQYQWQNGNIGEELIVTEPGAYSITRIIEGCIQTDSIAVSASDLPQSLGSDTTICLGDTFMITLPAEKASYLWDDGEKDNQRTVRSAGIYTVSVSDACNQNVLRKDVSIEDCTCQPMIPNVFTPNNDGFLDRFQPELSCPLQTYELLVVDKWGKTVFETSQIDDSWDGRSEGVEVRTGVYFWMLAYKSERGGPRQVRKGAVSLMR